MKTKFVSLYPENTARHEKRYSFIRSEYASLFGKEPTRFFSAPGRTEVCGNHTDHNHGKVAAAAVNLDIIAAVVPTDDGIISVKSEGFDKIDVVDTSDLTVHEEELTHSAALIRGVCAGLKARGYNVGGFMAYTSSDVLKGSGLSSSAAFEVLIGEIINGLYCDGRVSAVEIAQIAQYAENVYFGKPSGLMDQMASSVGGFISIDFADTDKPVIESMSFDLAANDCHLCIIDAKGSHAELTPEYAAVPQEMKSVAAVLGKGYLRELTRQDVFDNMSEIREKCGDRAVLRALHFFDENDRVDALCAALKSGDFESFLKTVTASGESSYMYLQNVFAASQPSQQSMSLALYLCQKLLENADPHAFRVHGGGFAGTVQAFVPTNALEGFKKGIEQVFGEDSCHVLNIRPVGGTEVEL